VARAVGRGLLRAAMITPGGHRRFSEADVEAYALSLQDEPDGARLITTGEAARLLGLLHPPLTTPGGHRRFDSAELSAALYFEDEI